MEIKDNKIKLNVDITEDVWGKVKQLVHNNDDVGLYISNANIELTNWDIPKAISGIHIEKCVFKMRTDLSGLERGRYLIIKYCSRGDFFSSLNIKNVDCRFFEFCDEKPKYKNIDESLYVSPNIENSVFHHCLYTSIDAPVFKKVYFIDKFTYASFNRRNEENIWFNDCVFVDFLEAKFFNTNRLSIHINDCNAVSKDKDYNPSINFYFNDVNIKSLAIKNSNLEYVNFNLFRKEIEMIDILKSKINRLELYTVDDIDAPKRIYSISIINSYIDELLLNNRYIVHSLRFNDSTFNNPPQMFGANMPHGSIFPSKENFLSRKGDADASCYRTLRYFMESQRDRELEGVFFTLEQESLLNKFEGFKKHLSLNYFYSKISNYGTNYRRPLVILFILVLLFTLLYSCLLSPRISPQLPIDWKLLVNSFVFTLKQTLQPFSSLRSVAPLSIKNPQLNDLFIIVGVLNSLLSITCLTLSGLAIRWKFKRG
ncbi:hypothetical protein [Zobellella maritima]|uniref:hypothetical protein n=1 Tax=Zobellella maritima TaxID=2059725 RepID=UPI001300BD38|nr:hypothetical protein [Zobellella maritima]